jgi:hypothetical protein
MKVLARYHGALRRSIVYSFLFVLSLFALSVAMIWTSRTHTGLLSMGFCFLGVSTLLLYTLFVGNGLLKGSSTVFAFVEGRCISVRFKRREYLVTRERPYFSYKEITVLETEAGKILCLAIHHLEVVTSEDFKS